MDYRPYDLFFEFIKTFTPVGFKGIDRRSFNTGFRGNDEKQ